MTDDDLKSRFEDAFRQQVAALNDYNRELKIRMAEFARKVEREVDEVFEAARALPDETSEIPWIGGTYPPHTPLEQLAPLKQRVVRARCCQHWFTFEAPLWAQPLPLRRKDCQALYNQPNRRLVLVGEYGDLMRSMGWRYKGAQPFEEFCAQRLCPPPSQFSDYSQSWRV